jgi:hypothetical protein
MMKVSGLFLMLVSFAGVVGILKCDHQKPPASGEQQSNRGTPASTVKPGTKEEPGTMAGEIKDLAAGNHCDVFESFVFVARDAQTYEQLQSLNVSLPAQNADFFASHAVVAAFLGQRRTGGFSVRITQGADGLVQVSEQKPKGMVTMVLSAPYRIVAVPVKNDGTISLSLDASWAERWRNYRVSSGELTITGGFAGIHQTSSLEGSVQIMRERTLATFGFDLKSKGNRQAQLHDLTSGTVDTSGRVAFAYLDSHALSGAIQSPFKAAGQFTGDEQELSLNLDTVPSPHVSDNFSATASLRATAITPRPPNRAVSGD